MTWIILIVMWDNRHSFRIILELLKGANCAKFLSTSFGFAKLYLLLLKKAPSPPLLLLFSVLSESRHMEGMHNWRLLWDRSVEQHPCQHGLDPASNSNNLPSPTSGMFCWKLEGAVSIPRNFSCAEIPNRHCNWESLVNI